MAWQAGSEVGVIQGLNMFTNLDFNLWETNLLNFNLHLRSSVISRNEFW
jgi:hypothetical protein